VITLKRPAQHTFSTSSAMADMLGNDGMLARLDRLASDHEV
jgi:hypothetical protein